MWRGKERWVVNIQLYYMVEEPSLSPPKFFLYAKMSQNKKFPQHLGSIALYLLNFQGI